MRAELATALPLFIGIIFIGEKKLRRKTNPKIEKYIAEYDVATLPVMRTGRYNLVQ